MSIFSLYACVFSYFLRYIGIASSTSDSSVTSKLSFLNQFLTIKLVQLPFPQSSVFFQIIQWYITLLVENGQPNVTFYNFYLSKTFSKKMNRVYPF